MNKLPICPCGSQQAYHACCGPYLQGDKTAPNAEALMRSRYTAYSLANIDYIVATMCGPAQQSFNAVDAKAWAQSCQFTKLEVYCHQQYLADPPRAFVEFKAYYLNQGQSHCLHERSEFVLKAGRWYYFQGQHPLSQKSSTINVGRNQACPCGSGKKFKRCCGR